MKRVPILPSLVAASFLLAGCSNLLVPYEPAGYVVQPGDTLYTIAWRHGVDHRALAAWNGLRNPDLIYVGQRLVVAPPQATGGVAATNAGSRAPPARAPAALPADPAPAWQWPTRGPVLSTFGAAGALSSGIGIGGRQGQAVNAAAAGRVVYAGGGLIGYGQLVIIKHNETYLSA